MSRGRWLYFTKGIGQQITMMSRNLAKTALCRNTLSFPAPLRSDPRNRGLAARGCPANYRSICRPPGGGYPGRCSLSFGTFLLTEWVPQSVLEVATQEKFFRQEDETMVHVLAETFPERSIAGASRVPFLWSGGAVRSGKAHAEDCLSAKTCYR